jgi:Domain of unknown function (DUF4956)
MTNFFFQIIESNKLDNWLNGETLLFLVRLGINLLSVFILIRLIYYPQYKRSDQFLTFFGVNIVIFFVTYLLNKVEMSMGAAFGLFAVFSMLRYRTEGISTKDMTYLFLVIAIGLISAISMGRWYDLSLICGVIIFIIWLLESNILIKKEVAKQVIYDKIELVNASKNDELIADLQQRLGLPIKRVEVNEIDLLKDSATITIFYNIEN